MRMKSTLSCALLVACLGAQAGEAAYRLREGAGREAVVAHCTTCHSLDYIELNSPFLDRKGWEAEVNKMIKAFHAPVPEADVEAIVTYLTAQYGKR